MQQAREFFNQQKAQVLDALPDIAKGMSKKLDPLFDINAEIARLALLFAPTLKSEVSEAGLEAMLLIGVDGFDTTDPTIAEFIKHRTRLVSTAINQETDKQLRAELAEGISSGEGVAELRARIERVYGAAAGARSERIARTETIRAENFASQEAWRQSGMVEKKEWYTAHDERVCKFCGPMNGTIVELAANYFDKGDRFTGSDGGPPLKIDFDDVSGPPLHVNCRCTLLPVLNDEY